jgi:hypothetical protein
MFVLTIPSITRAESSVAYRQDIRQDKYRLENQNRDKLEQEKQQREKRERDRQQRDRVERDRQQRERVERDRQQRERVERDRQQRERVERDRQQRERVERDRQRDYRHQIERHRDDRGRKGRYDWSHSAYRHDRWRPIAHSSFRSIPFNWHERAGHYAPHHHLEQIHDRHWHDRFPGLRLFRWRDSSSSGFWYNGHHIVDGIMFYNDSDELVSIGFFHNKIFIMLRDDGQNYENHDEFFLSWWIHH